jgi:hypothetical protein
MTRSSDPDRNDERIAFGMYPAGQTTVMSTPRARHLWLTLLPLAIGTCGPTSSEMALPILRVPGQAAASAEDAVARAWRPVKDGERALDVRGWRVIPRESGPVNYYWIVDEPPRPYLHGEYRPPLETTVLGYDAGDADRGAHRLRWAWRAVALPTGGNECVAGHRDSAAVLYVTWKRGLKYYTLKYAWSTEGKVGAVCDSKRNPFVAQDTIILRSGGPLETWFTEEIDLQAEFRRHFEGGDPKADVPELQGFAIMSDGDATNSASIADFADFVLVR